MGKGSTWQHMVVTWKDRIALKSDDLDTVVRVILCHTIMARKHVLIFTDKFALNRGLPFYNVLFYNNA